MQHRNPARRVSRLAAFIPAVGLYLVVAPPLSTVEDLYIYKGQIGKDEIIKFAMAGTFTFIYCCEESIPIQGTLHLIGRMIEVLPTLQNIFWRGSSRTTALRRFQGFTDRSQCSCDESSAA